MTDSCYRRRLPAESAELQRHAAVSNAGQVLRGLSAAVVGIQTSATFQSLPGPQITASYTATNAQIAPSLGRNLASGAAGTAMVPLVAPGTMFGDRLNQVDFRVSKTFTLPGSRRVQALVDVYNLFNANPVLALNTTFGPQWQRPTQILQGRLLKFGFQMDF